jgi:hypothetical protein
LFPKLEVKGLIIIAEADLSFLTVVNLTLLEVPSTVVTVQKNFKVLTIQKEVDS